MFTVLIVDDHPHLVESLTTTVPWQELGFTQIYTAYSGPEALTIIHSKDVHVLLTDIRMPGMTGLQLIEQTRAFRADISCVLLTGYAEFDYAKKAIELQTFRYLLKPVRTKELIACLQELTVDLVRKVNERQPPNTIDQPPARHQDNGKVMEELASGPDNGKQREGQHKLIEAVQSFVQLRIDGDLTLTAIAEHVYLHPVYLSKIYKEMTGTNISDYIYTARMDKAKELLKQSPLKIYEICEAVGYRSTQHFISEFKKMTGMTPKQYRDS